MAEEGSQSGADQPLKTRAAKMDLNSDNLDYFPESQQFFATGNAEVVLQAEGSRLKADKIIFNQDDQTILAIGNVRILKGNIEVHGDYAKIDMTKGSALVAHPIMSIDVLNIKSKTANVYSDKIEALKGTASLSQHFDMVLSTNKAGTFDNERMFKKAKEKSPDKKSNYRIVSKEMTIIGANDRRIIEIKNANIYAGKLKIAFIPHLEISTSDDLTQVETMLPEIGNKQTLGTYLGPGFVSYLPNGATLKTAPLLAFNSAGIGGMARLTTSKSKTEIAYATNKKKVVIEGQYKISPTLKINYAQNEYIDDGIMGRRMPGLGADLV
ncbi:MAG: LptA/OstA family protein, partial [Candidatus Gastranaerophilaceae bacterium]